MGDYKMEKVLVYFFMGYDITKDKMVKSKSRATLDFINKHNFHPILGSDKYVETKKLDENSLYHEHCVEI
jgi:hypothetical protein